MDGRAYGVWWEFVERQRRRIVELEEEARRRERAYTEAWFQVMAMGQEGATAADRDEAAAGLMAANAELENAKTSLAEARRRFPFFEKTLRQFTQQ